MIDSQNMLSCVNPLGYPVSADIRILARAMYHKWDVMLKTRPGAALRKKRENSGMRRAYHIPSGDPLRDADRFDRDERRWLARRPICIRCGEAIQSDHYEIDGHGDPVCADCDTGAGRGEEI